MIDDVIDPRETRPTIIRALEMAERKARRAAVEAPRRRAGLTSSAASATPRRPARRARSGHGVPAARSVAAAGVTVSSSRRLARDGHVGGGIRAQALRELQRQRLPSAGSAEHHVGDGLVVGEHRAVRRPQHVERVEHLPGAVADPDRAAGRTARASGVSAGRFSDGNSPWAFPPGEFDGAAPSAPQAWTCSISLAAATGGARPARASAAARIRYMPLLRRGWRSGSRGGKIGGWPGTSKARPAYPRQWWAGHDRRTSSSSSARRGDQAAFEELVHRHQTIAFRTARRAGRLAGRRGGGRPGRLREGVGGAAPVPPGRAVPAVAAGDRRQRGAHQAACGGRRAAWTMRRGRGARRGRGRRPRGGGRRARALGGAARRAGGARRARPDRAGAPLPARPVRARDGARCWAAARAR